MAHQSHKQDCAILAIDGRREEPTKCTPNVLPCQVHHNGFIEASRRYWDPKVEEGGSRTAYFRGRKLRGERVQLPDEYEGLVLSKGDTVIKPTEQTALANSSQGGEDDVLDLHEEEFVIMEEIATFDEFTVWTHEAAPDSSEDPYIKGVRQWLEVAEAIHGSGDTSGVDDTPKERK